MGVKLVVLDFDGTLTDVDKEAVPFVEGYKTNLAERLNVGRRQLEPQWREAEATIESNPSQYGWLMNGKIVAPAYADPLIMSRTIAGLLLKETGSFRDESSRDEVLDALFKENYGKLGIAFKDEADRFLTELKCQFGTYVVTNSGTDGVSRKVKQLPTDHADIPIRGDAKKYVLVPEWIDVPESVERDGFGRLLFLQRQKYWNVFAEIMREGDYTPEQVAVVGDIYELDLLLPEHKGMNIVLTPRDSTPDFEVQAVASSPRGYVARDLGKALEHLESLR